MLSRKSAGAVLFLAFLLLSGVSAADGGGEFSRSEAPLAGTNFDLSLSPSSPIGCGWRTGPSGTWSQPSWTLSMLAHGMEDYALTAVLTATGGSGFPGVALPSTTATAEGYFGDPIQLASNTVPTSFVPEPSTAAFLITGMLLTGAMLRQRIVSR